MTCVIQYLILFENVYIIYVNKSQKKRRNLDCWVIMGPLWVKYGGKKSYQPLAAQNPSNAPGFIIHFYNYQIF